MAWRTLLVVTMMSASLASAGCHRHRGANDAANANGANDDAPKKKKKKGKKGDDPPAQPWAPLPADGAPSGDRYTAACKLPVHKDDYAGFSIGYPTGWEVDYGSGTITVTKDEKGSTGALVFPARVRKEMKADQFADTFADALGKSIRKNGGTFQLDGKVSDGHVARAEATATIDGVKLRGPLQVVAEPGFATVKLYWAPVDSFAAEEPTLQGVVSCFKRQMLVTAPRPTPPPGGPVTRVGGPNANAKVAPSGPVAPLQPFQSRYFVGQMPAGWKVQDETPNGIDIVSADRREAVGFGWISNPVLPPQRLVMSNIQQIHPGARILSSGPVDAPRGSSAFAAEYEAPDVHGLDNGSTSGALQVTTSLLATPDRWSASKATLAAVAHTIQITPTAVNAVNAQVRAQIASLPRATPSTSTSSSASSSSSSMSTWETARDKSNQNFDDALRGQDRATSPSSGTEYVVPQSAWNPSGPQGAGYYRALPGNGGVELLNVQ